MRKFFIVLLAGLASVSGCRGYDALFGVLGNHYTDEGGNDFDKRHHYESRVEAMQNEGIR